TLNLAAFYYDYKDYQVSEIVDRSAFNRNFDAEVWGAEIEADWRPLENLRLGFKGGYQKTRIADGERAIDLMDRTAGRDDWVLVRPFPTQASSCVLPTALYTRQGELNGVELPDGLNPNNTVLAIGQSGGGGPAGCELAYGFGYDPVTAAPYTPNPTAIGPGIAATLSSWPAGTYPGWDPLDESQGHHHGEGFLKDLSGNELPNAPNWTGTIIADYTVPLAGDWLVNLHTDLHWQSESWWRIFNDHEYNKIDEYFTMNLAAIFTNEDAGWNIMAYVKNVTDETAITGAFLLSDDTALVTNVFLTEPRLYGLRVTKNFTGGPLLGSFGARRDGPYPFTLELGGQVQRHDAPNEMLRPDFIDEFDPAIDPSRPQNDDLDWGDGREVRLTWRLDGRPWLVSLGARYGETNGGGRTMLMGERFEGCGLAAPCAGQPAQQFVVNNYGGSALYESEEHTVVDFMVGREFGLGGEMLSAATLSVGLRYAKLASVTDVSPYGTPDWFLAPEYLTKYPPMPPVFFIPGIPVHRHEHRGELSATRDFKGVGPAVSWEASLPVIDWSDGGRVELDGSVAGGVLFGKQRASGEGSERSAYYRGPIGSTATAPPASPPIESSVSFDRSKNVTVPTVGLSLGLSYSVGGFKAGAGYRWERYFDAIDGGIEEHQDHDRTIDGPYFKLSVGFGG
ncbi:MAG TPA: Lpg1974 family pore-forming outer membrane protein, partial [Caulobacteraceae bacterium]|nr:Lpg1974 family pore-forming outer membrane protein [Caulobacteraceae bacterium]